MTSAPNIDIEDPEVLLAYLRQCGFFVNPPRPVIQSLAGGVSARTMLVTNANGSGIVVKQALDKLRVADDWFCSPDRMHREALGLKLLNGLEPRGVVPEFIFEDPKQHILVMGAVPQPHENFKAMLLSGTAPMELFHQLGQLLAALQAVKPNLVPNAHQYNELADTSFFSALRLEPYYITSAQRVPEAADFLHALIAQTRQHHDVLVHGDFSPKNILVHQGRLCLLDFEVIHLGDGGFDLGFSLCHLLAKALHLPQAREGLLRGVSEYLAAYRKAAASAFTSEKASSATSHTLACLLARVVGRSPLGYLNDNHKYILRNIALELMNCALQSPEELLEAFRQRMLILEGH